jgi:hypothetical protein
MVHCFLQSFKKRKNTSESMLWKQLLNAKQADRTSPSAETVVEQMSASKKSRRKLSEARGRGDKMTSYVVFGDRKIASSVASEPSERKEPRRNEATVSDLRQYLFCAIDASIFLSNIVSLLHSNRVLIRQCHFSMMIRYCSLLYSSTVCEY